LVENLSKLLQKFLDAQYKYLILQVNIGGGAGIICQMSATFDF
jgi:hypothetical protein